MPGAIAAVLTLAVEQGIAALTFATVAKAFVGGLIADAVGFAVSSIFGGEQKRPDPPTSAAPRGIMTLTRGSAEPRRGVFGRSVASGVLTFQAASGADNAYRHMVVSLTGHQIADVEGFYLNDVFIWIEDLDGEGNVTTGPYANHVRFVWKPGNEDDDGFPGLTAEVPEWTAAHRQRGIGAVWVRLKWSNDVFPTGIPNIRVMLRGLMLWDPRRPSMGVPTSAPGATGDDPALFTTDAAHGLGPGDRVFLTGHVAGSRTVQGEYWVMAAPSATTLHLGLANRAAALTVAEAGTGGELWQMRWHHNAALAQAHYFLGHVGMRGPAEEVDLDTLVAEANLADEMVDVPEVAASFTVDAGRSLLIPEKFVAMPGDEVTVESTGDLPGGLQAGVAYYAVGAGPVNLRLAASYDDAIDGSWIALGSAGSGVLTIRRKRQPRYTCHGAWVFGAQHVDVMEDLMTASAGAAVYVQGRYRFHGAAYVAPSIAIGEASLRGPIEVDPDVGLGDVFNRVSGLFVSAADRWQETTAPVVANQGLIDEDGEAIDKSVRFPFSVDPIAVQRLGQIILKRARQAIVGRLPCNLTVHKACVWGTASVTLDEPGWDAKTFRLARRTFGGPDGIGIDLVVQEDAPETYQFTVDDAVWVDPAPNTNLDNPLVVGVPTGLALASGTDELLLAGDGTVVPRIKASWTDPADAFVDRIELQFRVSDEDWQDAASVPVGQQKTWLSPVEDGVSYDVRVRGRNGLGVRSAWLAAAGHTVVGKTAVPSDVASFSAQQNGNVVTFRWTAISDADRAGYELRYMAAPFVWESATVLTRETKGTLVTNAGLPPGAWVVGIKAVDTSGNYSATARAFAITVANVNDVIFQQVQAPRWRGTLDGLVRHDVSGRLVPVSQSLASALGWEVFDQFVPDPVAEAIYTAPEIDVGFDATDLRVWSSVAAGLGPGEAGSADPLFDIDYRDEADAYDGWEEWSVGTIAARRIKSRARLATAGGVGYLADFTLVVDVPEREETGSVTVAGGGTAVVFSERFHAAPTVQVTAAAVGGAARYATYENVSATGVTIRVFDASGSDVGGDASYTATGA